MPPKRITTPVSLTHQAPKNPKTPKMPRSKRTPAKTLPPRKDLTRNLSPWTMKGFHNPPAKAFTAEQLAKLDTETRKRMWDRFPIDKTTSSEELYAEAQSIHAYLLKITIQIKTRPHKLDERVVPEADKRNMLHALATLQEVWMLAKRGYTGKAGDAPLLRIAAAKVAGKVVPLTAVLADAKKAQDALHSMANAHMDSHALVLHAVDGIIALYPWSNSTYLFRTPKDGVHEAESRFWDQLALMCAKIGDEQHGDDRVQWYRLCGACSAVVRHMCIVVREDLAAAYLWVAQAIKICGLDPVFLLTHTENTATVADELEELYERMRGVNPKDCAHSNCCTRHVCC